MKSKENVGYVFFLSIVAAFGGFLFGYDTAVVSGTMDIVEKQFSLTPIMKGWFGSCAIIGSIIGALSAGVISDYFGRKKVMLMSAIIFVVSGIGCAVCSTFGELVLWRVVGGIGIGVVSVVSPIYISEISITKYRGLLVSLYQLSITVGILASYGVNYLLDDYAKTGMIENALMNKVFIGEVWRGMLGMESAPALLFLIVVLFIPESPRWLIVKSKLTQAGGILRKIYNAEEDVQTQIHDIEAMANKKTKSDFSALFQPGIRFAVIIGVCIAILGQFMGVNAVIYYGPTMFSTANVPCPPLLAQVLVGIVNTLATILAMFIIDRIGRKKLIYFGVSCILHYGCAEFRDCSVFHALHILPGSFDKRSGLGAAFRDVSDESARNGNVDSKFCIMGSQLCGGADCAGTVRGDKSRRPIHNICCDVHTIYADNVEISARDGRNVA
jgi:sugar porter (SP) family MFS transporter